jgi:DNA-binding HxlR family transcriptional regulator
VQYAPFRKYALKRSFRLFQQKKTMPDFIFKGKIYYNPVQLVMEQIGGTWKAPILWRLQDSIQRYGELRKDIPHISDKMLTTQLRELEDDGYIERKVYAVVPPKTEYSLTEKGKEAIELITVIRNYGLKMIAEEKEKSNIKH